MTPPFLIVETGQPVPGTEGELVRCALESLALRYRQVLGWLEELTGNRIEVIHIVGGGSYRLRSDDPPFGQSWLDWIDAVSLGADFYDGDADGIHNPVDKNVNGVWDLDEDCTDILGDETLWCVYHDGLPVLQRRWNTTIEVGIEVRQTVFAYSSVSELQNIIFIRYRIKYVGLTPSDPDELTDVYFGVWDDPDIGTAGNDLVGCDTLLSGQFSYNWYTDPIYGNNPPSFFFRTLSGPATYIPGVTFIDNNGNGTYDEGIDTPIDTAYAHPPSPPAPR